MAERQKSIIVAGATGNQGQAVIHALAQAETPFRIVGLTRNPSSKRAQEVANRYESVTMVQADMGDLDSLLKVFQDAAPVHGVFSVQNYWIEGVGAEGEVLQGANMIKAAEAQAGIEMFVYTSTANADPKERDVKIVDFDTKWEIEQKIAASKLPYLIVRPVQFMQNFFGANPEIYVGDQQFIGFPGINRSSQLQNAYVDLNDMGAIVADALKCPKEYIGRTLVLASVKMTPKQLEEIYNKTTGAKAVAQGMIEMADLRKAAPDAWVLFDVFRRKDFTNVDLEKCKTYMPQMTSFQEFLVREGMANKYADAK